MFVMRLQGKLPKAFRVRKELNYQVRPRLPNVRGPLQILHEHLFHAPSLKRTSLKGIVYFLDYNIMPFGIRYALENQIQSGEYCLIIFDSSYIRLTN